MHNINFRRIDGQVSTITRWFSWREQQYVKSTVRSAIEEAVSALDSHAPVFNEKYGYIESTDQHIEATKELIQHLTGAFSTAYEAKDLALLGEKRQLLRDAINLRIAKDIKQELFYDVFGQYVQEYCKEHTNITARLTVTIEEVSQTIDDLFSGLRNFFLPTDEKKKSKIRKYANELIDKIGDLEEERSTLVLHAERRALEELWNEQF